MGNVEFEHGNMLENTRGTELMARADVALVNNEIFGEKRELSHSVYQLPLETKRWYCTVN